jgi:hypothetical protein
MSDNVKFVVFARWLPISVEKHSLDYILIFGTHLITLLSLYFGNIHTKSQCLIERLSKVCMLKLVFTLTPSDTQSMSRTDKWGLLVNNSMEITISETLIFMWISFSSFGKIRRSCKNINYLISYIFLDKVNIFATYIQFRDIPGVGSIFNKITIYF